MLTYFSIGLIVMLFIRIERFITRPEFRSADWTAAVTWLVLLVGVVLDTVIWPLAIICEFISIIYRKLD